MILSLAAALLVATPATLNTTVAAAKPGDTVRFAPGVFTDLLIQNKQWSPAVTLDMRGADVTTVRIQKSSGLNVIGGTFRPLASGPLWQPAVVVADSQDVRFADGQFIGAGHSGRGLIVRDSRNVAVTGARFTYLHIGIQYLETRGGEISRTRFDDMRSDGINIAASHQIVVDQIECRDFSVGDGDHPDCVQLWSIKGKPPTSDIVIKNSKAIGAMQGFCGFDHDAGGFDRITVTGNTVHTRFPQGIAMYEARDSVISGNDVSTMPGSKFRTRIRSDQKSTRVERNREAEYRER